MGRNRTILALGACFLTASAAWADGVAYIDCANHSEETQVFGKPRRTPESVASLACGERFNVLQYGFIFSRIQTKDGQIGYIYSNLISADHTGATVAQAAPVRSPAATPSAPVAAVAQPKAIEPAPTPAAAVVPAPAQPVVTTAPAIASSPAPTQDAANNSSNSPTPAAATAAAQSNSSAAAPVQAAAGSTATAETPRTNSKAPVSAGFTAPPTVAPAEPATAADSSAPIPATAASVPEAAGNVAAPATSSMAQPAEATPATAQPEPAPAAAPAIRPVAQPERWEKPNAGGIRHTPLIELFGGYAFARFDNGGGTASNLSGAMGSFGWNLRPWLQIVADSSYNVVTISGVKNVLYGNHYGPRVFWRARSRWGVTPFVEGLIGGTRADTSTSGATGYTTSVNTISYKAGGGLDIKPSRHVSIRLLDVDYYRTSFGTNAHQNNYWASTGIVLRFLGGSE